MTRRIRKWWRRWFMRKVVRTYPRFAALSQAALEREIWGDNL